MGWWFAVAGELHTRNETLPEHWKYQPAVQPVDPDNSRAVLFAGTATAALFEFIKTIEGTPPDLLACDLLLGRRLGHVTRERLGDAGEVDRRAPLAEAPERLAPEPLEMGERPHIALPQRILGLRLVGCGSGRKVPGFCYRRGASGGGARR